MLFKSLAATIATYCFITMMVTVVAINISMSIFL